MHKNRMADSNLSSDEFVRKWVVDIQLTCLHKRDKRVNQSKIFLKKIDVR